MEDPVRLLRRLKLGREEHAQRLLTMLILDGPYPKWNSRSTPSALGLRFLQTLDELCFGSAALPSSAEFVDELDLPRRVEGERGGAPDYAVFAGSRLWIIELKTETASHRPAQIPYYFELAAHHYPELSLDLTYLTPAMPTPAIDVPGGSRFAHITWSQAMPLVRETWSGARGVQEQLREGLVMAISGIGSEWAEWRDRRLSDPVALAVGVAQLVAADGEQRALAHESQSLDELQALRLQVRDRLAEQGDAPSNVQPWLWSAHTSGGRALSRGGQELGYELRLSRRR